MCLAGQLRRRRSEVQRYGTIDGVTPSQALTPLYCEAEQRQTRMYLLSLPSHSSFAVLHAGSW
ncbi:MAG: hypothetical protein ACP5E9_09190 [Candidatus Methanospirareceae archaeon]